MHLMYKILTLRFECNMQVNGELPISSNSVEEPGMCWSSLLSVDGICHTYCSLSSFKWNMHYAMVF